MNKKTIMLAFLFFVSMAFISLACAQTENASIYSSASSVAYPYLYGSNISAEEFCRQGQDFIVQIPPGACQPAIIRSDLLEEQPVPVYCNLIGIKVNPLIQVPVIRNIYPIGAQTTNYVSGVGYYPARQGTLMSYNLLQQASSATLNNLGYVMLWVKQQPVEKEMPDYIEANLSMRITYDVEQSFGVGQRDFILQEISDADFERHAAAYSFWNGKGYIRASKITEDSATIEVYGGNRIVPQIVPLTLNQKKSNTIYLPGFYCAAGVQLQLDEISYPSVKAKMNVDGVERILTKGAKLSELSSCTLDSIEPGIAGGIVRISCAPNPYTLSLESRSAKINNETIKTGEAINSSGKVYLVDIGKTKSQDFVVAAKINEGKDIPYTINAVENAVSAVISKSGLSTKTLTDEIGKESKFSSIELAVVFKGKTETVGKTTVKFDEVKGLESRTLGTEEKGNYIKAIQAYESVANDYAFVIDSSDNLLLPFGLKALKNAADLAEKMGQSADEEKFLERIVENYKDYNIAEYEKKLNGLGKASDSLASGTFTDKAGQTVTVVLEEITEPTKNDINTRISVNGVEGSFGRKETIAGSIVISDITDKNIAVQYTDNEGKIQEAVIGLNSKKAINNISMEVKAVYAKKEAKVSVIPFSRSGETVTNFTVKVGIEKRAIQLSPEQMKHQINETAKIRDKINSFVTKLGNVVETGKKACLITGAALAVKNLVSGEALARAKAMHGIDGKSGWTEFCKSKVSKGDFKSIDFCYANYSKYVDAEVDRMSKAMKKTDEKIRELCAKTASESDCAKEIVKQINKDGKIIDAENLIKEGNLGKEDAKQLLLLQNANKECEGIKNVDFSLCTGKKLSEGSASIPSIGDSLETKLKELNEKSASIAADAEKLKAIGLDITNGKIASTGEVKELEASIKKVGDEYITAIQGKTGTYKVILDKMGEGYVAKTVYRYIGNKPNETAEATIPEDIQLLRITELKWNPFAAALQTQLLQFFESGKQTGMPYIVPFEYNKGGFYVLMESKNYDDSGAPNAITVYNVGGNGRIEFGKGDDIPYVFETKVAQISTLPQGETKEIAQKAFSLVKSAANQYRGSKITGIINIDGKSITIGKAAVPLPDVQCQDFMSPSDCKILFNVCDPVMCPSSRCDYGGAYPVNDVVQSGLLGSLALCSKNFIGVGGDVLVPVCLSGIYASLQNINSMLQAYQSCMQESLDSGKTVGICDEVRSVYLCDFVWKEAAPIIENVIPGIISKVLGAAGGEYAPQNFMANYNSFTNSITYFTTQYAKTAFNAFSIRSTANVGTEICKNAFSLNYPNSAELLGSLTAPESPSQFYAYFDEISYSTVTYPATSQYKVYYHIYAGEDKGVTYSIYLMDNPESGGFNVPFSVPIDYGYLPKGQSLSQTKDMLQPAGYRQLCVEIDLQRECGFGKASTSYLVNSLSDNYLKQQLNTTIASSDQCISGTPSFAIGTTINPQQLVEQSLQPNLFGQGINRICSHDDPGKGAAESRWSFVGWCDQTTGLGCWLDEESVKGAIKNTDIVNQTLQNAQKSSQQYFIEEGSLDSEKDSTDKLAKAKEAFETASEKNTADAFAKVIPTFQNIFDRSYVSIIKAQAMLHIGQAYSAIAGIIMKAAPPAPSGGTGKEKTAGITETTAEKGYTFVVYTALKEKLNEIVWKFYGEVHSYPNLEVINTDINTIKDANPSVKDFNPVAAADTLNKGDKIKIPFNSVDFDKLKSISYRSCSECGKGLLNICDISECQNIKVLFGNDYKTATSSNCFFIAGNVVDNPLKLIGKGGCSSCSQAKTCFDFNDDEKACGNSDCTISIGKCTYNKEKGRCEPNEFESKAEAFYTQITDANKNSDAKTKFNSLAQVISKYLQTSASEKAIADMFAIAEKEGDIQMYKSLQDYNQYTDIGAKVLEIAEKSGKRADALLMLNRIITAVDKCSSTKGYCKCTFESLYSPGYKITLSPNIIILKESNTIVKTLSRQLSLFYMDAQLDYNEMLKSGIPGYLAGKSKKISTFEIDLEPIDGNWPITVNGEKEGTFNTQGIFKSDSNIYFIRVNNINNDYLKLFPEC